MNGLTVILAFVAVLILFEEVLPRWRFRKWRRVQARLRARWKKHVAAVERSVAEQAEKKASPAVDVKQESVPVGGRRIPAWKVRLVELAQSGNADAMMKLGKLAYQNNQLVEAYFWKWRLQKKTKMLLVNPTLQQVRRAWQKKKCPSERQNVYEGFDETQAAVIRAYMRFLCGVEPQAAKEKIVAFAAQGVEEAKWMVESGDLEKKVKKEGAKKKVGLKGKR